MPTNACPFCELAYSFHLDQGGMSVKCPGCKQRFVCTSPESARRKPPPLPAEDDSDDEDINEDQGVVVTLADLEDINDDGELDPLIFSWLKQEAGIQELSHEAQNQLLPDFWIHDPGNLVPEP